MHPVRTIFSTVSCSKLFLSFAALLFGVCIFLTGCASEETTHEETAVEQTQSTEVASDADELQVTVTVKSDVEGATINKTETVEVPAGSTAFDALTASSLDVQSETGPYGDYVVSIDGIENGAHGEMSGWRYNVNGQDVTVGAGSYELTNGDTVNWIYAE